MFILIYERIYTTLAIFGLLLLVSLPVIIFYTFQKHQKQAFRILLKQAWYLVIGIGILFSLNQIVLWTIFKVQQTDRDQIDFRYMLFYEAVMQENYEAAYGLMTPDYRKSHDLLNFQQDFVNDYYFPPPNPNRFIRIIDNSAVFAPDYDTNLSFWQNSITFDWEKIDKEWYLTGQAYLMLD